VRLGTTLEEFLGWRGRSEVADQFAHRESAHRRYDSLGSPAPMTQQGTTSEEADHNVGVADVDDAIRLGRRDGSVWRVA
jgi:hypothetical protein